MKGGASVRRRIPGCAVAVKQSRPQVDIFNEDATRLGSYGYTLGDRLSSRLATQRSTDVIVGAASMAGWTVLDMGCGDGFYTVRYWDQGQPRGMFGVDAAQAAIKVAMGRGEARPIRFFVGDVHQLPFRDDSFDLALLQGLLHHDSAPRASIREALRLAPKILIHEPNGNNLGLKLIERTSRYHIEHGEKSFRPRQLARWLEDAGGEVTYRRFAGFVPMFCADWLAVVMKAVEPLVERLPVVRALACSVCTILACRKEAG